MSRAGADALNRYLQENGILTALSWKESTSGPKCSPVWTMVCKINGEELGRATGSHKHMARDSAANQALAMLVAEK